MGLILKGGEWTGGQRRGWQGEGRTGEGRVNLALYLPPIAAGLTAS